MLAKNHFKNQKREKTVTHDPCNEAKIQFNEAMYYSKGYLAHVSEFYSDGFYIGITGYIALTLTLTLTLTR